MTERTLPTSVQHLGFAWFAMVMGLSGLSLAWLRAVPQWGPLAVQVSAALGLLASGVLVVLLGATVWRVWRFPAAVLGDMRHPMQQVFVAALPASLVLMATVLWAHGGVSLWADGLWMSGSAGLLLVTVGVVRRWFKPGLTADDFWPSMTPALFVPVVGNVLPALAGVSLGHPVWAAAQFGMAAVLWPVLLALVLVRIGLVGLWPLRLMPTTFITIAPPSVLALSGYQLGAPEVLVHMLWGVALLFTLVSMSVFKRCLQQPFGMTFWAMSFPLAASAALSLHLTPTAGWAQTLAGWWLLAITLVIGSLLVATVRGLIQGQLLVPDSAVPVPGPRLA